MIDGGCDIVDEDPANGIGDLQDAQGDLPCGGDGDASESEGQIVDVERGTIQIAVTATGNVDDDATIAVDLTVLK